MLNSLKLKLIDSSGIWFRKIKYLPAGADLFVDLGRETKGLDIIFDVGGNVGQTVDRFKEYYPQATIYTFEPVAETFQVLKKNMAKYKGVHCENVALGQEQGQIEMILNDAPLSGKNSLNKKPAGSRPDAPRQMIQMNTLDHFAKTRNIEHIDMLKIDTEGWELNVIKGADQFIKQRAIDFLFCEVGFNRSNHQNTYFSDLNEYLIQYGYHLYSFYDYGHAKIKTGSQYANALFINSNLK